MAKKKVTGFEFEQNDDMITISQPDPMQNEVFSVSITVDEAEILIRYLQDAVAKSREKRRI